MNLWEKLNIVALECIAYLIEGALMDRRSGKILPLEKRIISADKQERILFLLNKLSELKILRHKPILKDKLVYFESILEGRVIKVPTSYYRPIIISRKNK